MANRQRAEARRKAQAKAARRGANARRCRRRRRQRAGVTINIWVIIVVVLALVIGGVILGHQRRRLDRRRRPARHVTSDDSNTEIPASQSVTVTGEVLIPYDSRRSARSRPFGSEAPVLERLRLRGRRNQRRPCATGRTWSCSSRTGARTATLKCRACSIGKRSGAVPAELNVIGVATAVSPSSPNYPPHEWFSNRGWSWPVLVDESQGDGQAGKAAVVVRRERLAVLRDCRCRRLGQGPRVGRGRGRASYR